MISIRINQLTDSVAWCGRYVLQPLLMESHKISNNPATTGAIEEICSYLESLEF